MSQSRADADQMAASLSPESSANPNIRSQPPFIKKLLDCGLA